MPDKPFREQLECWDGPSPEEATVLDHVEGVRLQGGHIVLELLEDNWGEVEYAIPLANLVDRLCEFLAASTRDEMEDDKAAALAALDAAMSRIRAHTQYWEPRQKRA